jgi:hypothetical protein
MSHLRGVVYDAPTGDYPTLAVVLRPDGDVLVARPVASRAEGEAMLAGVMAKVQAQVDAMFGDDED